MNVNSATASSFDPDAHASGDPSEGLTLAALIGMLWRRKGTILFPVLIVFAATLAYVTTATPKYTSVTQILVDAPQNTFSRTGEEVQRQQPLPDDLAVGSHEQLLLSRDLAKDIALSLNLSDKSEFLPSGKTPGFVDQMLILVGLAKHPDSMTVEERVINRYFSRLSVERINDTRVIAVRFTSRDPLLAAQIANSVSDRYIELLRDAQRQSTSEAALWLEQQIEQLRNRVAEAEATVEEYRSGNDLLRGAGETTLSSQRLSELSSQLVLARTSRAEAQARAQMITELLKSGGDLDSAADVLNSPLIQRLQEQQVTLRGEIAELSATLLPSHPRMMQLKAELRDMQQQIRAEAEKVVKGLENESSIAGARENAIRSSLNSLSQDAERNSGSQVELRALEREATAQRELLESFLARFREASAQQQLEALPVQARIISRAAPSTEPSFPRKAPILAMASLGTLLLMVAIVMSVELMKLGSALGTGAVAAHRPLPQKVDVPSPDEIEPSVDTSRVVNFVPRDETDPRPGLKQAIAEIYAHGNSGESLRTFICSPQRQTQENYSALNVAREIARDGHSVVVVDGNMRVSRLAKQTGLIEVPGFSDLLRATSDFVDVLQRDALSRAHIITAGAHMTDPARMIDPERLEQVLDALEGTYDHIVLDGPPAMLASEAQLLAQACDCALIVEDTLPGGQKLVARTKDILTDYGRQPVQIIHASADVSAGPGANTEAAVEPA